MIRKLRPLIFLLIIFLFASLPAEAKIVRRNLKPKKHSPAALVFSLHPELRGSPETLKKFNDIADEAGLPRIDDRAELDLGKSSGFLVSVSEQTQYFYLDKDSFRDCFKVKVKGKKTREICFGDRRYLASEALEYLSAFSQSHSDWFSEENKKKPIRNFFRHLIERRFKVTSLVRTMEYQRFLARGNPNAKQALCGDEAKSHDTCSAHVRGYAFDISAKDFKNDELLWVASFLAKDIAAGKILAIYESKTQANFHVMVIPKQAAP